MIELNCESLFARSIWLYIPCHITYAFQSESTSYICLNVKEILTWNRREIWSLSDGNETRTQNHLVRKQILNYLAKTNKWLSWILSTFLYVAFNCRFLFCHLRVSERIHALHMLECHVTRNWCDIWRLNDCHGTGTHNHLVRKLTVIHFKKTDQMVEMNCEYLSIRYIWLYILVMPRTRFRQNRQSIFTWISKNSQFKTVAISEV